MSLAPRVGQSETDIKGRAVSQGLEVEHKKGSLNNSSAISGLVLRHVVHDRESLL